MATSIKDVARVAGVSAMTVSNVLNERSGVSEATRQAVREAIEQTGYTRNASARQLRLGHSLIVQVVVQDAVNPFYADLCYGVEQRADEHDAVTTAASSHDDGQRLARLLDLGLQQRPLGVVLATAARWDEVVQRTAQLEAAGVPVTAISDEQSAPGCCTVCGDDRLGGEFVGVHLGERGHRRVAFVGQRDASGTYARRLDGLREGLDRSTAAQGHVTCQTTERDDIDGGRAAGRELLASQDAPTAAFCINDLVALGVLQAAIEAGVQVPEQLAIVGYDDIPFAAGAAIPLSSVHQSGSQMGRRAAELVMVARHEGTKHSHKHEVFAPELVVRRSSDVWHPVD